MKNRPITINKKMGSMMLMVMGVMLLSSINAMAGNKPLVEQALQNESATNNTSLAEMEKRQAQLRIVANTVSDPAKTQRKMDIMRYEGMVVSLKQLSEAIIASRKAERTRTAEKLLSIAEESKVQTTGARREKIQALLEDDRSNVLRLRQMRADAEWARTILYRFTLMKKHWGKWKFSGDGESMISEDQEFMDDFELLTRRINAIGSMQTLGFGLPAPVPVNEEKQAASCGRFKSVLSVVTADWNSDGDFDRAVLVKFARAEAGAELFIYQSDPEADAMKLTFHKTNAAWSGGIWGTLPHLELDKNNNLVIHSQNSGVGRGHWKQAITVMYQKGEFIVSSFTYEARDTLKLDDALTCSMDFITRKGMKNGIPLKTPNTPLALAEWSEGYVYNACGE